MGTYLAPLFLWEKKRKIGYFNKLDSKDEFVYHLESAPKACLRFIVVGDVSEVATWLNIKKRGVIK